MKIAVTGSGGFIGSALMPALVWAGHDAAPLPRENWAPLLSGADALIHLAGLAHRSGPNTPSAAEFNAVNAVLPQRLYTAARDVGVPQMIHVSTIAVLSGHPGELREDMLLAPTTAYDVAKAKAETALLGQTGGPSLTIVRPPLVYGPGAKGNLASLLRLCASPLPLPFASVHNRRTLVGRANLVDALLFLLAHPGQRTVHVTDGVDLSLAELIATVRMGLSRGPGLAPFPPALLNGALRALGRGRIAGQLLGDQRVVMTRLPSLGWQPPNPPRTDLLAMAKAYAAASSSAAAR